MLVVLLAKVPAQDSGVPELLPIAARLRGLPPPTELRTRIVDEASPAETPPSDDPIEAESAALHTRLKIALGLSADDASPGRSEPIDHAMRSGQVAGFYDPVSRTLTLVRPAVAVSAPPLLERSLLDWLGPPFIDDERSTLVHEIGHALQHARAPDLFGEDAAMTTDLDLAVRTLLEGDAVLLEAAFALERAGAAPSYAFEPFFASALAATFDPERMPSPGDPDAGPFEQACFDFPYFAGPGFTARLGAGGRGFAGVTSALLDPPLSTEQILHPEKYRGPRRDDPTELALPDLRDLFLPGGLPAIEDVLGEFGWSVLLEGRSAGARVTDVRKRLARAAAAGWDGDACLLYVGQQRQDGLVVLSTWDTPADAAEFARALALRISEQRPVAAAKSPVMKALPGEFVPLLRSVGSDLLEGVYAAKKDVVWIRGFPVGSEPALLRRVSREVERRVRTKLR